MGSTFTVTIDIAGAPDIVGYDVTLLYNKVALSATTIDFSSPTTLFGSLVCAPGCNLGIVAMASDKLGEIRSARVLLGGQTAQSPGTLVSITFTVIGAADSPLTLDRADIAEDVNGIATPVSVTIVSGNFFLPPNILFVAPSLLNVGTPRVGHIHKLNPLAVQCTVQLDPNALRSGFGGCTIDLRDPNGIDFFANSGLAFLLPGQEANVTATFSYTSSATLGSYAVFAIPLDCVANDLSSCAIGSTTASGLHLKINP